MKTIKTILAVALILAIAIVVAIVFLAEPVIQSAVEQLGSHSLGVPVTVDHVRASLIGGSVRLENLMIGNPAGFKTPWLFKVGEIKILVDLGTVAKKTIVITAILVNGAEVTYEKSLTGSNLSALLDTPDETSDEKPAPVEEDKKKSGSSSVVIDDFLLENGKVHLSATIAGGHALELPLPPIHLTGIGKESNGTSIREIILFVLRAIAGSVTRVATGSVELVGQGLKEAGSLAVDGVKGVGKAGVAVGEGAVKGVTAVGKTAETGVKEVGKGVAAVGGATLGGVKAIGGAAVKGIEGIGSVAEKGVGKLVGGEKKSETNEDTNAP